MAGGCARKTQRPCLEIRRLQCGRRLQGRPGYGAVLTKLHQVVISIVMTKQNTKTCWVRTWASEGFFSGGGTRGFFQNFSRGVKSGEMKTTFFAENFKIQGRPWPPALPSDAHECACALLKKAQTHCKATILRVQRFGSFADTSSVLGLSQHFNIATPSKWFRIITTTRRASIRKDF